MSRQKLSGVTANSTFGQKNVYQFYNGTIFNINANFMSLKCTGCEQLSTVLLVRRKGKQNKLQTDKEVKVEGEELYP